MNEPCQELRKNERSSFPLLDNIETTVFDKTTSNPLIHKASEPFDRQKKYDELNSHFENDNSDTIKSVTYYKKLTDELAGLIIYNNSILEDRAVKMLDCGTYVETLDDKVITANFCRQRLCPMCQRRRSLKTAVKMLEMQQFIENNYNGIKYLHLVLTVPNVEAEELSETIDRMYKSSSELFRDKQIKNKFKGVFRCLEVTYNTRYRTYNAETDTTSISGKCFHPHLHCLIAVGKSYGSGKNYLRQSDIMLKWNFYLGMCQLLNVHIKAVKNGDMRAVAEIAKYCVKPLDIDCPPDEKLRVTEIIFSSLHGRRLCQSYGIFKEVAHALKIDFDKIDYVDELKNVDFDNLLRLVYNRVTGRYEVS